MEEQSTELEELIRSEYEQLIESEDYSHYSEYRSQIDKCSWSLLVEVGDQIASARQELDTSKKRREAVQQAGIQVPALVRLRLFISALGAISLVLGGLYAFNVIRVGQPLKFIVLGAFLLIFIGSVATVGGATSRIRDLRETTRSNQLKYDLDISMLNSRMKSLVKEAVTHSINEVLGPEGKLAFPTEAPRLIELSTSEVVPSRSSETLRRFIDGHSSSAIGIAGPRGIGKSALMRGLINDTHLDPHVVLVTAPVKYDASDFVRSLYLEVAKCVMGAAGTPRPSNHQLQRKRQRRINVLMATALIYIGILMITYDFVSRSDMFSLEPINLGPLTLGGVVSFLTGGYIGFGLMTGVRPEMNISRLNSAEENISEELAHLAIDQLTYEIETNSRNKNGAKFLGGQISVEGEKSVTQKNRLKSHPQLVKELRSLLGAFARDQSPRPVIIMIDELDKISSTSDLVDTVNGLKDLFHIEGVHFVVSVSTDALLSFEQRGLLSRDAFDSSFDSIIAVQRLSLDESLRVLSARSTGFPPTVGAFCHAWSGGLPRDLLRVARRCVEIQRLEGRALSMATFVQMIVAEELATLAEGVLSVKELSGPDRKILLNVRVRARKLVTGRGNIENTLSPVAHTSSAPSPETSGSTPECSQEGKATVTDARVETIVLMTQLGEALAKYVSRMEQKQTSTWISSDKTKLCFESSAHAMSVRGTSREIVVESFADALEMIEMSCP